MGVQFNEPPGYSQIRAWEVWSLFRDEYPDVREQPPLPPMFETFGPPSQLQTIPFRLMSQSPHPRYWFARSDESELVQFQKDRLLHNWKKTADGSNVYPRFESLRERFAIDLSKLNGFFQELTKQPLHINQCEINYVNNIESGSQIVPSDWIRLLNLDGERPEDFALNFRERILGENGRPLGRFFCEIANAYRPNGQSFLVVNMIVRGAPADSSIEAALEFLTLGREKIVTKFAAITTDSAHATWERVR